MVYRKDREEALKQFTQVSDTVQTRQAQMAGKLASNIGYSHAPEGPQHVPPSSYHPPPTSYQPPQPSYQPPPQPSYQPPPQPSYQVYDIFNPFVTDTSNFAHIITGFYPIM